MLSVLKFYICMNFILMILLLTCCAYLLFHVWWCSGNREDSKDSLKFYTDPGYFFELWSQEITKNAETQFKKHRLRKGRAVVSALLGPDGDLRFWEIPGAMAYAICSEFISHSWFIMIFSPILKINVSIWLVNSHLDRYFVCVHDTMTFSITVFIN